MNTAPSHLSRWSQLHPGTRRAAIACIALTAITLVINLRSGGVGQALGLSLTGAITGTIVVVLGELYHRNARHYP